MAQFRDSNDFRPTIDAAAEQLGISATAIEKDYWVSQILSVPPHVVEPTTED